MYGGTRKVCGTRGAAGIDMIPTTTGSDLLDLSRLLDFTATLDQLMIVSLVGS